MLALLLSLMLLAGCAGGTETGVPESSAGGMSAAKIPARNFVPPQYVIALTPSAGSAVPRCFFQISLFSGAQIRLK